MSSRRKVLTTVVILGIAGCFTAVGIFTRLWYISNRYPSMASIISRLQTTLGAVGLPYVEDLHEELKQMGLPNRVTLQCACGEIIAEVDNLEGKNQPWELYTYHVTSYSNQNFTVELAFPPSELMASRLWVLLCASAGTIIGIEIAWRFLRPKEDRKMEEAS